MGSFVAAYIIVSLATTLYVAWMGMRRQRILRALDREDFKRCG